jgi:hypothetical protein
METENRKILDDLQAAGRHLRISSANLLQNRLRDDKVEIDLSLSPPLMGYLLMGGDDQVAAGPTCQVTGNRRF